MLLMSRHLQVLEELLASEAEGHAAHAVAEASVPDFRVLELQGLALPQLGLSYSLTYEGREAGRLLDAMRQDAALPAYREKDPGWRFLGSEILTAMDNAVRAGGRVGPAVEALLHVRGFAQAIESADEPEGGGIGRLRLNAHGAAWLALARRLPPRLEITNDLAAALLAMPVPSGYISHQSEGVSPQALAALEAMDLVVWSVPDAQYGTLTALGLAVYEALRTGSYPTTDAVLDDAILQELQEIARKGEAAFPPEEQLAELQRLGYVTSAEAISVSGEAALRARTLLQQQQQQQAGALPTPTPTPTPPTFAITHDEVELLRAVQELSHPVDDAVPERPESSSRGAPTRADLHQVLVDRWQDRYQEFVREYGATVHDELSRKRQAQTIQKALHEHQHAFGDPSTLEALLVSLESFALLRVALAPERTEPTYHLTRDGERVLGEQGERASPRDITATAVKSITTVGAVDRFGAPATAWIEQAQTEGLLGTRGIAHAGMLYAELAQRQLAEVALSRFECEVLLSLPQHQITQTSAHGHSQRPSHAENEVERRRRRAWALDTLDAYGLADQLADGQVIQTDRGRLVAHAVRGALELAFPVTPALLRLLAAVEQVGQTLYVQEEKLHEVPAQWEELAQLSGLEPDPLREAVHIAKLGRYLGDAGLTEAGHDLLNAFAYGGAPRRRETAAGGAL